MKKIINQILKLFFFALVFLSLPSFVLAEDKLLQQSDLEYKGSFRVPVGNLGGDSTHWSFGAGGQGITYNASRNSLIMMGRNDEALTIEISIPEPVNSSIISALPFASLIQAPGDIIDGQMHYLKIDHTAISNGGRIGGYLVYNDKLVTAVYAYYATEDDGHLTHGMSSLNWVTNGSLFTGFKRLGISPLGATKTNCGFVGGYMGHIPPEWQTRFGYPALSGGGAIAVMSRASYGPSVSGFDPENLTTLIDGEIVDTEIYLGYPALHKTIGDYNTGTLYYGMGTNIRGVVFPQGTDTIMFFGRLGRGYNNNGLGCYGTGTTNEALHGTEKNPGEVWCYDPANLEHGGHAYPYVYQVWWYNANDLLEVKNGLKQFWEIIPYARSEYNLPFETLSRDIGGVAYDPISQRIFISQIMSDTWADVNAPNPIIHVFRVNTSGILDVVPPIAPSGLSVL